MATCNHFYDLPVYKLCKSFREKISSIVVKRFPKEEEYNLKSQALRSSRSIRRILQKALEGSITRKIFNFAGIAVGH
jgi:four helix bundle protein